MARGAKGPKVDITELSVEILETIMGKIAASNWNPKIKGITALALSSLNRCTRASLYDNGAFALLAKELVPCGKGPLVFPEWANDRHKVALFSGVGCETCRKDRIRKVYAEFGVRICQACFEKDTINRFYLTEPVLKEQIRGLGAVTLHGYNPHARGMNKTWTAYYHYRPAIVERLRTHGVDAGSIELYQEELAMARLAAEDVRREREREESSRTVEILWFYRCLGVPKAVISAMPRVLTTQVQGLDSWASALQLVLADYGMRPVNLSDSNVFRSFLHGLCDGPAVDADDHGAIENLVCMIRAEKGDDLIEREIGQDDERLEQERKVAKRQTDKRAATNMRQRAYVRLKRAGLEELKGLFKNVDAAEVLRIRSPDVFVDRCRALEAALAVEGISRNELDRGAIWECLVDLEKNVGACVASWAAGIRNRAEIRVMNERVANALKEIGIHVFPPIPDILIVGEAIITRCAAVNEAVRNAGVYVRGAFDHTARSMILGTLEFDLLEIVRTARRLAIPVAPRGGTVCACGSLSAVSCVSNVCRSCCVEAGRRDDEHICFRHDVNV